MCLQAKSRGSFKGAGGLTSLAVFGPSLVARLRRELKRKACAMGEHCCLPQHRPQIAPGVGPHVGVEDWWIDTTILEVVPDLGVTQLFSGNGSMTPLLWVMTPFLKGHGGSISGITKGSLRDAPFWGIPDEQSPSQMVGNSFV